MGTAEPVCAVVPEPALDPDGVTELHPHAVPGGWLIENPGWLSGGAYRWFRDELGSAEIARAAATGADVYELLNAVAAEAPPGADGVLWMPALAGATAPEWNADARAGWFGLTAAHGRRHLARALLEGNAFALRDVLEAIRRGGPPAGADRVRRRRRPRRPACARSGPNVTGLPVTRPDDVETTARGAAMLAAAGAGLHADVRAAGARDGRRPGRASASGAGDGRRLRRALPALPRPLRGASAAVLTKRAGDRVRPGEDDQGQRAGVARDHRRG